MDKEKTCENFFEGRNKIKRLEIVFGSSNWGEKGYFGFGDLIRILNIFLNLESEETVIRSSSNLFSLFEELVSNRELVHLYQTEPSCNSNFVKLIKSSGEIKTINFDVIFTNNGKVTKNETFSLEDKIIRELREFQINFGFSTHSNNENTKLSIFFGTNPDFLYKAPTLDFQKRMAKFFMSLYPTNVYGSLTILETIRAVKNSKVCITVVNSVPHICSLVRIPHIVLSGPSAYQQDIFFKRNKVIISDKACDFRPCYSAIGDGFCGGCMDNFDLETINVELKKLVNF